WGPVSFDELLELLREQRINMDSLVWRNGMHDWTPLHAIPEMAQPAPPDGSARNDVAAPHDAPTPVLEYGTGADPLAGWYDLPQRAYAGFWLRFVAAVVDWLVMAIPVALLSTLVTGSGDKLAILVLYWLYFAGMETRFGAT